MYHAQPPQSLTVRLAQDPADLRAVQALRYQVFVAEGGADGPGVDHVAKIESDPFDQHADHLMLIDDSLPSDQHVIGTYRVMTDSHAAAAGGFYSASEYDLSPLITSGQPLLELGRSCLHPAYRGGAALLYLWRGLADYVAARDCALLFGVASFPGTNPEAYAHSLSLLHTAHRAPANIRPKAQGAGATPLNRLPADQIDRRKALTALPSLIKSYLRLGGQLGDGAYIDTAFQTTDVCIVLRADQLPDRQRALLVR